MVDGRAVAPPRLVTALIWLIGLAIFINYVDRGTLGIAAPRMKADLGLTATQFGLAASAFFWVYAPGQLVMGWLVSRVSAAWLLAAGLALWGLATALTGLVTSLPMLVALRLLLGTGEATAFVCAFKLIVDHTPEARRGAAFGAVSVGLALGPAIGTLGGGLMLAAFGWRWLFAVVGLATLAWLLPWLRVAASLPKTVASAAAEGPGYWSVFANRPALSLSLAQICWAFALYFVVTWLPLWLVEARGYALADMAWLGASVFAAQALAAYIVGKLNDRLLARGVPANRLRRAGAVCGAVMIALGIAGAPMATGSVSLLAALMMAGAGIGVGHISINLVAQVFAGPLAMGK
jgi:MFS family permease